MWELLLSFCFPPRSYRWTTLLSAAQPSLMVRGSGYDPGDNETTSSSGYYDGSVGKWPTGSVKIKSSLHKYGLWNVVKNGPTTKPSPVQALPSVGKEVPPVPEPTSM